MCVPDVTIPSHSSFPHHHVNCICICILLYPCCFLNDKVSPCLLLDPRVPNDCRLSLHGRMVKEFGCYCLTGEYMHPKCVAFMVQLRAASPRYFQTPEKSRFSLGLILCLGFKPSSHPEKFTYGSVVPVY